ncbi:MAG: peptidoglycan DD-metalloendopeptidase family protein [Woeseiaceae bacterium]
MTLSYYKILILFFLIVFNTGCLRFVEHKKVDYSKPKTTRHLASHHIVKAGETLYSIAFQYGRDHRDIARWNKIGKSYTIFPKQRIRVIPIKTDKSTHKKTSKKTTYRKITSTKSQKQSQNKKHADRRKYQKYSNRPLVWKWPTKGRVSSTFSYRDPGRRGIDIVGRKGQPIRAAAAGYVVYTGSGLRGYGNLVIIKHNETFFSAYAHTDNVVVKEKEKVKLGQQIADMSNTSSDKIKLHFEVRRNGKPVNPLKYLPK